jgi:hypothetical protein
MNNPPSSEILYLRHSQAKVLTPSGKQFIKTFDQNGAPVMSRQMDAILDVIIPMSRKLRNL